MIQSTLQTPSVAAFVPPASPFVALAFLGTAVALAIAVGAALLCLALRRRRAAAVSAGLGAALAAAYGAGLLALSLASRDVALSPGAKKYFCEIDCHLAYSVTAVERPAAAGIGTRGSSRFACGRGSTLRRSRPSGETRRSDPTLARRG